MIANVSVPTVPTMVAVDSLAVTKQVAHIAGMTSRMATRQTQTVVVCHAPMETAHLIAVGHAIWVASVVKMQIAQVDSVLTGYAFRALSTSRMAARPMLIAVVTSVGLALSAESASSLMTA